MRGCSNGSCEDLLGPSVLDPPSTTGLAMHDGMASFLADEPGPVKEPDLEMVGSMVDPDDDIGGFLLPPADEDPDPPSSEVMCVRSEDFEVMVEVDSRMNTDVPGALTWYPSPSGFVGFKIQLRDHYLGEVPDSTGTSGETSDDLEQQCSVIGTAWSTTPILRKAAARPTGGPEGLPPREVQ